MANQTEKVYLPNTFGNVKTFSNGDDLYNIDFTDAKGLIEFIQKHSEDNKFRIEVQKQKKDPTRASVALNTWKPTKVAQSSIEEDDDLGLPF